jgi:hypothetical protein
LGILIERAKQDGQVCRLLPHLVEGGVSIVQHADDTILLMEHEQLLGLKINFRTSDSSFLVRQKRWRNSTHKSLDVMLTLFLVDT